VVLVVVVVVVVVVVLHVLTTELNRAHCEQPAATSGAVPPVLQLRDRSPPWVGAALLRLATSLGGRGWTWGFVSVCVGGHGLPEPDARKQARRSELCPAGAQLARQLARAPGSDHRASWESTTDVTPCMHTHTPPTHPHTHTHRHLLVK
jgi:hypothetical protein